MKKLFVLVSMVGVIALWSANGFAHETKGEMPWERFSVEIGPTLTLNDANIQLGAEGLGVTIDAEDLFGMTTETNSFRLDGKWNFTKSLRHRFDFTWLSVSRQGYTTLGRDLEIGDTIIPLGSQVNTSLNVDLYRIGYGYSIFMDDRVNIGIGAGIYVLPINFSLDTSGFVTERIRQDITAPLPVFGVRADFAITPKWFLRSRMDTFYLEYDRYKGAILDSRLAVEYKPFKHIGFGIAWDNFRLAVESEKGSSVPGVDFKGQFKFQNVGFSLYLRGSL